MSLSVFPDQYDTFSNILDCTGAINATWMNKIQDCLKAVEEVIGTGILSTVATTLIDAINEIMGIIGDDELLTIATTIIGAINEHEHQLNISVGRFDRRQVIPALAYSLGLDLHRSLTKKYIVGEEPLDGAYDGTYLWITNSQAGTITKFNPSNVRKLSNPDQTTIGVSAFPSKIVYDFYGDIWVCCYNEVIRINPETNVVVASITSFNSINFNNVTDICIAETIEEDSVTKYIFIVDHGNDRIVQINMGSNTAINAVAVEDSPQSMIYDGYYLWVTHSIGSIVSRIDIYSSSIGFTVDVFAVAGATDAIVFDGENVYVGTIADAKLYKYNIAVQFGPNKFTEVIDLYDEEVDPECTGARTITDLLCDGKYLWALVKMGTSARLYKLDIGHPKMGVTEEEFSCKKLQEYPVDPEPSGLVFDGINVFALSTQTNACQKVLTSISGIPDHNHSGFGEGGELLSHFNEVAGTGFGHVKFGYGEVIVGANDEESVAISSYSFTTAPLIIVLAEEAGGSFSVALLDEEASDETNDQYWWYLPDPGTEYFVVVNRSPGKTKYGEQLRFKWWAIGI